MLGIKGKLGEKEVYALEGRFHFYEGYSMKEVCYPFYVLTLLGVEQVVLTTACGGINREFAPGTLMLLTDFINMMGTNPVSYTHLPSKEALLLDMVDHAFAKIHRCKQEILAGSGTLQEKLRAVIIAMPTEYAALDLRQMKELDEKYPVVAARVRSQLENGWDPTMALLEPVSYTHLDVYKRQEAM